LTCGNDLGRSFGLWYSRTGTAAYSGDVVGVDNSDCFGVLMLCVVFLGMDLFMLLEVLRALE
jgi:hypothetical protein